ncbi:nitrous oxide reductase accessory protein NosL [Schinkia sp. CFF1]
MRSLSIITLILLAILTGCSSHSAFEPIPIDSKVDSCDQCHMGIQSIKSASEIIMKDGTPKKFDDIGCMVLFLKNQQEQATTIFVHDYATNDWVEMNKAVFIQGSKKNSPMGYRFVAFSSTAEAKSFQSENGGTFYTAEEVLKADVQALKKAGHGSEQTAEHNSVQAMN